MKLIIIICCLLIAGQNATAQDKSNDTTARYFIIQASIGNLQEIKIGRLALMKSNDAEIKSFASRMITDHGNAQAALIKLINLKNFQVPKAALDTPLDDLMLKDLSATDFDRMYVHMMVPDHRQAVHLYEKYAITGKDPAVAAFAAEILPQLKQHLLSISAIEDHLKPTGTH